jgi:hypothetical protein
VYSAPKSFDVGMMSLDLPAKRMQLVLRLLLRLLPARPAVSSTFRAPNWLAFVVGIVH